MFSAGSGCRCSSFIFRSRRGRPEQIQCFQSHTRATHTDAGPGLHSPTDTNLNSGRLFGKTKLELPKLNFLLDFKTLAVPIPGWRSDPLNGMAL
jgi:hypothetical protein